MIITLLQTLVGDLTNDPNHDRYTTDQINLELDNTQDKWNAEAKILRDTVTLTVVSGQNYIDIFGGDITYPPIAFNRVTHKGIPLIKKDKTFFDLYLGGSAWESNSSGTPKYFYIAANDPAIQRIYLYPTPRDEDAGAYLVVEFIKKHNSMFGDGAQYPFNTLEMTQPYHYGLAYDVAARLLLRDPSQINAAKSLAYQKIADDVFANVVQVFKALEREEPYQVRLGSRKPVGQRNL